MSFKTKSLNQESHIQWLDRQNKGESGYPVWMSQSAIDWLQQKVSWFIIPYLFKGKTPDMDEIIKYWSNHKDLPYDLFFLFQDGLRGVTHKALIDAYPSLLLSTSVLMNLIRNSMRRCDHACVD